MEKVAAVQDSNAEAAKGRVMKPNAAVKESKLAMMQAAVAYTVDRSPYCEQTLWL